MKHFIVFIFMLLFFIPASQAQIRIEPYEGLGFGISDSKDFQYLFSGVFSTSSLGIRIGSEFLITHTGVDIFWNPSRTQKEFSIPVIKTPNSDKGFSQSGRTSTYNSDPSASALKGDFNPIFFGVYTSIDLLILSNVFGTVFGTINLVKWKVLHKGYGVKVGCTLLTIFRVQLNIEAQVAKYFCSDKSAESKCKDFDIGSVVASISFPFRIDPF